MRWLWRRTTHRWVHLPLAVAIGVFVYSPLRTEPSAVFAAQAVVFPLLALSGLLMWKGSEVQQWFRGR